MLNLYQMTNDSMLKETGAEESVTHDASPERARFTDASSPLTGDATELFVAHLRAAAKPVQEWRCGLEWELIGYTADTLDRLDANQVASVLRRCALDEADAVREGELIIEVEVGRYGGRLTVVPGGQLEFSSLPQASLARMERDATDFLARLHAVAVERGILFLAAGFDPVRTLDAQHWYPKRRYAAMRPALERAGTGGLDMMTRTAAVQTNLDFDSAKDLARKFTLASRLAPIVTAMFANSPFEAGRVSGYKSTRAAVWLATDAARTGVFESALDGDFTLERFVAEMLDVPLLFVRRGDDYDARVAGMSFREYLDGGARSFDVKPRFADWLDHLSTVFTDARLRPHLETRSADSVNLPLTIAAQSLWRGLLYDSTTLDAALRLAPRLTMNETRELATQVARDGLAARVNGVSVLALAQDVVRLAAEGLRRVAPDEEGLLNPLCELILEDEMSPADVLLKNWGGRWNKDIRRVAEHLRCA